MAVCSPLLYAYSVKTDALANFTTCVNMGWIDLARQVFNTLHTFVFFLCPLLFMVCTHCQIYTALCNSPIPTDAITKAFQRQKKVFKILSVITATFLVCWCSFVLVRALRYFYVYNGGLIWTSSQLLVFTSSAANPFIYGIYSEKFRRVLKNFFCCRKSD